MSKLGVIQTFRVLNEIAKGFLLLALALIVVVLVGLGVGLGLALS